MWSLLPGTELKKIIPKIPNSNCDAFLFVFGDLFFMELRKFVKELNLGRRIKQVTRQPG